MIWKSRSCIITVAIALALAGCVRNTGSRELGGAQGVSVVQAGELPSPTGQADDGQQYHFVIGPFDKIVVDMLGFEELHDRHFQVDGSGNITLPIAGHINLQGKTLAEAQADIASRMSAGHVRDPQVSVNLEESSSQYVTVDGEVREPGNYPLVSKMTLMRAIAAARGVNEFARLDDVVIHRTVNGQQMVALYQLSGIRRGAYADPTIYPRDTIVVGDSPGRRIFNQFLQITPALASPLVALFNNGN